MADARDAVTGAMPPAAGSGRDRGPLVTHLDGGKLIVLTAPLTETIDHAGYFIQMSMASLPIWLEGILNKQISRNGVTSNGTKTARPLHAGGLRVLEALCCARYSADDIVCLLPRRSRQVHRSGHADRRGVDAQPARRDVRGRRLHVDLRLARSSRSTRTTRASCSTRIKANPYRDHFKVIVGGSGGWQIAQTDSCEELERRLRRRGPQRIGGDAGAVSPRRSAGETLPRADRRRPSRATATASWSPTSAPRSAWSR